MKIVIIGGSLFQTYAIKKSKDLGLEIICVDQNPEAPGVKLSDFFINKSTRDYEGIIQELKERNLNIDGVITVGTDMSKTVYEVSKAFNLDPGFENPSVVTNKINMREQLKKNNVLQPGFVYSDNLDELIKLRKENKLNFPLVIKPSENMGARGVVKVASDEEIKKEFGKTKDFAFDGRVLLEEFMDGPELSIETLVLDGESHCMVIGDRHIEMPPYFVETGHSCPSILSNKVLEDAKKLMSDAAKALGIYNGPAKGDIKITSSGVMVGEIAARLSGGFMSSHTLPLSTGIDAIKIAVKQRVGLPIEKKELKPCLNKACIERAIILDEFGKINNLEGKEEAEKVPGVILVNYNLYPGREYFPLNSNIGKIGNIIIQANSLEEADKIYKNARSKIKVEIQ